MNEKGRSASGGGIKTRFNTQSEGVRRHFYRPLTFYVALLFDTYQSPLPHQHVRSSSHALLLLLYACLDLSV